LEVFSKGGIEKGFFVYWRFELQILFQNSVKNGFENLSGLKQFS